MSKKFMILMLIVFGVLLYLTSYALRKQTEEPPPPPKDPAAEKAQEEKEVQYRLEAVKKQQEAEKKANGNTILTDKRAKEIAKDTRMPLPPDHIKPPAARDMNTMDISADWTQRHADGAAGIDQEIHERLKNTKPALKPQLKPADK